MTLKDTRESYYGATARVSDISRNLNLTGFALVWLFRLSPVEGGPAVRLPVFLLVPLALFVTSLTADLLQYLYGSAAWGIYNRVKEREGVKEGEEFMAPLAINWPTLGFFWSKSAVCLGGYALLSFYVAVQLVRGCSSN